MAVPSGLEPHVAAYLQELEDRVSRLEAPQEPSRLYACTTANMPAAADFIGRILRNTTLNILAVSDGANWIRQDTGAAI